MEVEVEAKTTKLWVVEQQKSKSTQALHEKAELALALPALRILPGVPGMGD